MRGNEPASGNGLLWLRIVLLLAGVGAGLWLSFTPAPGIYQIRAIDRARYREVQPASGPADAPQVWTVQGDTAWQALAAQLTENIAGKSKDLLPNLNTALGENDFYFPANHPLLANAPTPPRAGAWPLYVELTPIGQTHYLQVTHYPRGVGLRHVPAHLAYPLRPHALWCFIAGIAAFLLVPHSYYRWPTLRKTEILVGLVIAGGFAAIWFLPPELPRPLEPKRPAISPEAVAHQEEIAKEIASLNKQMSKALPDLEKGTPAERKAKLEAYKALVARHAKLSEELLNPDAPGK